MQLQQPTPSDRPRLDLPSVCGALAVATGLATFAGWITGLRVLATFGAGNIPMAPSTAVLLILFGLVVVFRSTVGRDPRRARVARAVVLLGAAVAAILFVTSTLGIASAMENLGIELAGTVAGAPVGHMSPLTALLFAFVGVATATAVGPEPMPAGRRRAALVVALGVVFASLVLVVAYALGGPVLYESGIIPPALNTSLGFLVLGAGVAGVTVESLRAADGRLLFRTGRTAMAFVLVLSVFTAFIVAVAYGYFRVYQSDFRIEAGRELSAVADLKAVGIVEWRRERLGDARVLSDNGAFQDLVRGLVHPPGDPGGRSTLGTWLEDVRAAYGYERASLLLADGSPLLMVPDSVASTGAVAAVEVAKAIAAQGPTFVDFHRSAEDAPVRLGVMAPVFDQSDQGRLLAVLYLEIDPETHLYPFLRQWPGAGARTSQTVLVRREGDDALLLSDLRGRTTALQLRVPLSEDRVPAVMAILGRRGVMHGIDDQGVPVGAVARGVPGSPWFIVARMDGEELLAPMRERLWWVVGLTGFLLLALVGGAAIVWQDGERRHFRAMAEAEAREHASEARYRDLFNSQRDAILVVDRERRITNYNAAFEELFGYAPGELVGLETSIVHESPAGFDALGRMLLEHGDDPRFVYEGSYRNKNGETFPAETSVFRLRDTESGEFMGMVGIIRDVTEMHRAEREQEELRAQLVQAQKLESVGRLAGGVAHDFNNMLAVILGNVELILGGMGPDDSFREDLLEIHAAADRSAKLTRQLLAFARKQIIRPERLDLHESLSGMSKMLRRLIGEHVELVTHASADLWPVRMDPTQLDQVLANLVVNARDAIDGAGRVTLEIANTSIDEDYVRQHPEARLGDFVMLAVTDDGRGMSSEVLAHVFEPFYTTKALGEGTGLGLATVYGIALQNGGFVNVYSEPGHGTTIRLYFPRCEEEGVGEAAEASRPEPPHGGNETVLIVEDEGALLRLTTRIVEGLGYRVLPASTPEVAITLAEAHRDEIAILLTDVIMPHMNGRELAEHLRALVPDLAVLYMSGYAGHILGRAVEEGMEIIQKPFTRTLLAQHIHETLERARR